MMTPICVIAPIFITMASVDANLVTWSETLRNYRNRHKLSFQSGTDHVHHNHVDIHHAHQHHHHNRHPLPPVALPLMFGGGSSTPQQHNYSYEEEVVGVGDPHGNLMGEHLGGPQADPIDRVSERELECLVLMESDAQEYSHLSPPRLGMQLHGEWSEGSPGDLDEEYPVPCNRSWDKILCWPPTSGGSLAVLPCFDELNGIKYNTSQNATRYCHSNGTWAAYTDYNGCSEVVQHSEGVQTPQTFGVELATTIYFVGYALSLVALAVAIFIFLYFKDLRCLRNTIHTNLMCTYMLADFTWILTLTLEISTKTDSTTCVILVIVLHYFHLTNFFWMFVEGLYLYMLVVETFKAENIKLRVYVLIGWGIPVVVTAVWVIAKGITPLPALLGDTQLTSPLSSADSSLRLCPWMRPHSVDWIYQTPAIGLLFVNSIFLVLIMWVLITKLRSATNAETQQYRKATKALLVLIPLLGITYVVVIAGPRHGLSGRVYGSICALLLSTQGFTVALFYCFLNSEVQNHVRHHIERWKAARTVGSRRTYSASKDWSPKTRTESVRLFSHPNIAPGFVARVGFAGKGKKRDSHNLSLSNCPENHSVCSTVSISTPMPAIISPPTQYLAPRDNDA
ncbi:diuretic hormone receptor-like [Ischnura elegans]|uniref:diuretic hormone receptor-like n=1 Tax=Ischnura elegans TaxID=197161 RepID=UPI001ED8884C|nr:diuretic hormone receptor-like [Ischnura elegans]